MKGKKKNIKYSYFEVVTMIDKDEELYDLRFWIEKMLSLDLLRRKRNVNGIEGRLENVSLISEEDGIYALNFMRLDVASDSYKVKENQEAEHIDLGDDEYIGRNTVALYDSRKSVIMIQNNRGSYSHTAIQSYINECNNPEICYFRPIVDKLDIDDCKRVVSETRHRREIFHA